MVKIIPYNRLSKASRVKHANTLKRLENSGITSKEALSMSDSDLKQALGFKGKKSSFEGLKRNIRQLSFNLERKRGVLRDTLPKYVKQGYRGKGLNLAKRRLSKSVGLNVFFDISNEMRKKHGLTEKQSWKYTRDVLAQAKKEFNRLKRDDKIILQYFS